MIRYHEPRPYSEVLGSISNIQLQFRKSQHHFERMYVNLRHVWNSRFLYPMSSTIESLPNRMYKALDKLCNYIDIMIEESVTRMDWIADLLETQGHDKDRSCPEIDCAEGIENIWDQESIGLLKIDIEPRSQKIRRTDCNVFTARLWGMRKEELLSKLATQTAPLPFCELDSMRFLIVEIESRNQDLSSRFVRMIFGCGQSFRAFLVCLTTSKEFDRQGRIRQVFGLPMSRPSRLPRLSVIHDSC